MGEPVADTSPFANDPAAARRVEAMRARFPAADPLGRLPDVHPEKIPRHVAIIMDGNGRWAMERGFPRIFGHRMGAAAVREVLDEAGLLGIECVTLYSFSLENWKRPKEEVDALMLLCTTYLDGERQELVRKGLRFRAIGRREGLPEAVVGAIEATERATASCTGPVLALAINYGARAELVDAARSLARDAAKGAIRPEDIDESLVASRLATAGLPDPDLLVRTAGEMRVSNFLLWQISYAEIVVSKAYWPDFGREQLRGAIREYASRSRRFGGLDADLLGKAEA